MNLHKYEDDHEEALVKLEANLKSLPEGKIPLVLVSTGSYCPVHRQHISMFEEARAKLNTIGNYHVVAGFLSPSHDSYVGYKLIGPNFVSGYERAKMIEIGVAHSQWISVHRWEIKQSMFIDFPYVIKAISDYIRNKYKDTPYSKIQVSYLCGADHAERCNLTGIKPYGVIIMARPGSERAIELYGKSQWVYIVDTRPDDASSTLVRKKNTSRRAHRRSSRS